MKFQLIRNATLRLSYADQEILIDPYFAAQYALPSYTGKSPNPLVGLPIAIEAILKDVTLVMVSHLHSDHFDTVAQQTVPKTLPDGLGSIVNPGNVKAVVEADKIDVVYGHAQRIVDGGVEIKGESGGIERLDADHVVVCAGGLGTPVLLASSLGQAGGFVPGYHDHPMAYVAKLKLRPGSRLKKVSSTAVRSGRL